MKSFVSRIMELLFRQSDTLAGFYLFLNMFFLQPNNWISAFLWILELHCDVYYSSVLAESSLKNNKGRIPIMKSAWNPNWLCFLIRISGLIVLVCSAHASFCYGKPTFFISLFPMGKIMSCPTFCFSLSILFHITEVKWVAVAVLLDF